MAVQHYDFPNDEAARRAIGKLPTLPGGPTRKAVEAALDRLDAATVKGRPTGFNRTAATEYAYGVGAIAGARLALAAMTGAVFEREALIGHDEHGNTTFTFTGRLLPTA